jgi:hypothetical protein
MRGTLRRSLSVITILFAVGVALETYHQPTSAASILVQPSRLTFSVADPKITGLFGRFPPLTSANASASACSVATPLRARNTDGTLPQQTPATSCGQKCPFNTSLAGECQKNYVSRPGSRCYTDCTSYTCRLNTGSGCCGTCTWDSGYCVGCLTPAQC